MYHAKEHGAPKIRIQPKKKSIPVAKQYAMKLKPNKNQTKLVAIKKRAKIFHLFNAQLTNHILGQYHFKFFPLACMLYTSFTLMLKECKIP